MADVMTVEERSIREERAKVFKGMADIMEKQRQGIGLSDSERSEFDKRSKKLAKLDADLARVQEFNKLATVQSDIRDVRADSRGAAPVTGAPSTERIYEEAFLQFMRDGHTDGMDNEHRSVFRTYSTPQYINRPPTANRYEQFIDTHGVKREVGYKDLRTADIMWDEKRAVNDANALSSQGTGGNGVIGASAGSTGYDAGYMIPQGFWHNLQIALKEYGGLLPYVQMLQTDSGQPMPWPTVLF